MNLSPRERVLTALAHRPPDRVPFSWGFCATLEMMEQLRRDLAAQGVDWDKLRATTDDKVSVMPAYIGPPLEGEQHLAIWGIHTRRTVYGGGAYEEFTDFPLAGIEHARDLAKHRWPDPGWYDDARLPALIAKQNPQRRRAVQLSGGNPFELYCWMTGLEEAMMNLLCNPELVNAALDHITTFLEERLRRALHAAGESVDLVFLADDLGGQNGLLMSRESYRMVVQPFHRRLTDCIRAHAPHARCLFHTDGAVFEIIPDLLDAGIDVLEAVQTDAAGMDPSRLKAAYGDRLSFHGAISVQQLLPHSDEITVEQECRQLVEILGHNGGYIAAPAHAIQVGTPPANVIAMLRAVLGEADLAAAMQRAHS